MSFGTIDYVSCISEGILEKINDSWVFFFNGLESSSELRYFLFYLETLLELGLDVRNYSQLF